MNPVNAELTKRLIEKTSLDELTEEKIRAWQLTEVRKTAERAQSAAKYYQLSKKTRKSFYECSNIEDFPFTFPDDLARDPFAFLCVRPGEVARIVTSSGTTGYGKRAFFTENDQERTVDFFHRGMAFLTEPGEKVAIFLPGNSPGSVGDLLAKGLVRLGAEPEIFGIPQSGAEMAKTILDGGFSVTVSLPMDLYRAAISEVAPQLKASGVLKNALVSADTVTETVVRLCEKELGCRVFEHYGMTETCFGGGVFCRECEGYHLREADMLFEIIDTETGKPCQKGEWGEVTVTTFAAEAMPLLRYRTGDIGRFLPRPCRCGYPLPVLVRVRGRFSGLLTLPDGSRVLRTEFEDGVIEACRPEDIRISYAEKVLEIELVCPKSAVFITETMKNRLSSAGAELVFKTIEQTERDPRAMTKRRVETTHE